MAFDPQHQNKVIEKSVSLASNDKLIINDYYLQRIKTRDEKNNLLFKITKIKIRNLLNISEILLANITLKISD